MHLQHEYTHNVDAQLQNILDSNNQNHKKVIKKITVRNTSEMIATKYFYQDQTNG